MAGNWPRISIQALINSGAIVGHKDGNHGSLYPRVEEFGSVGVPFLTAKNLSDGNIDIQGAPRLAYEKAEALRIGFVQPNDVLLSHNATVGRVAVMPKFEGKILIGTSLTYFRVDPVQIEPRYLAAFFSGLDFQNQLAGLMSQTTRNQVPITSQRNLSIVLPPLPQQKAIARILGALDDKIELNRRMNATLEAMARALFQSWFVDFDPVHAKQEGRAPASLDESTAALFPGQLQDSELGLIPEGWEVRPLGSLLDTLETGRRPKGGVGCYTAGVPSVGAESIHRVGAYDYAKTKFIPEDFFASMKSGRVESYDVLLYKDGGKPGVFLPRVSMFGEGFPFETYAINEHVFRMRSEAVGQPLLYFQLSSERLLTDLHNRGGKAAIPGINQTDVRTLQFLLPSPPIADAFNRACQPLLKAILYNANQSRTLANLRDELLPKLLSGEISAINKERAAG